MFKLMMKEPTKTQKLKSIIRDHRAEIQRLERENKKLNELLINATQIGLNK